MTAETTQAPTYTGDTYIPLHHWGKDHWTTLAYMETIMVELGYFPVCYNPRMRSNRRNTRVMLESRKAVKLSPQSWKDYAKARGPVPWSGGGSRLITGQEVPNHDDWACVQDMANEGLLNVHGHQVEPGTKITLSNKGWAVIHALREHKAAGGNFASFRYEVQP